MDIFEAVKALNLADDTYVIVGSGTLIALGLISFRHDVDMCVTPEVYSDLRRQGWEEVQEEVKPVLKHGVYDVGVGYGEWDLPDLQSDALVIKGIPFMSLKKVLQWKRQAHRPKDLPHIALIEKYLKSR